VFGLLTDTRVALAEVLASRGAGWCSMRRQPWQASAGSCRAGRGRSHSDITRPCTAPQGRVLLRLHDGGGVGPAHS